MCVQVKTNLNKILLMQRRILRTIFFRRKFDHITEKFSEYNIDTVFELFLDTVFKEVIYQKLGKSPLKLVRSSLCRGDGRSPAHALLIESLISDLSWKFSRKL